MKRAGALREEYRFAVVTDEKVRASLGLADGVHIYKANEKDVVSYKEGPISFSEFLHLQAVGIPNVITKDNLARYTKGQLPVLKMFADVNYDINAKQSNYFMNRLKKISEEFKGKLLFALADKAAHSEETAKFGFTTYPAVGIEDHVNSQRYPFRGEFSIENVVAFVKEYLAGNLKSYIKSEPTPTQTGPVTIVTGENFKDIVLDNTKDVLFEMYAPWCGHCKTLAPIYDELAESLKNVENVVIAKMDATANDSPHGKYQAKGFPTIFFAAANNKDAPVTYSGARDVKSFTEFLKKNSASWNEKKTEEKTEL